MFRKRGVRAGPSTSIIGGEARRLYPDRTLSATRSGWQPVGHEEPGVGALLYFLVVSSCLYPHYTKQMFDVQGQGAYSVPMIEDLHPRRLEILRFLAGREADGEPPSTREIGAGVGLKSSQSVYQHLRRMEGDGLVVRRGKGARSVRLTERGWQTIGEMPLMGRAAAGRGLEAVATNEAYSLAGELLLSDSGRQRYLLRILGDSMVGAKISDGDLVVVEAEEDPPDGTIVVALLAGDEVAVKRLYRKNSHVLLVAESPDHEDIEAEWGEVQVQGRVVYVIHAAR